MFGSQDLVCCVQPDAMLLWSNRPPGDVEDLKIKNTADRHTVLLTLVYYLIIVFVGMMDTSAKVAQKVPMVGDLSCHGSYMRT